MASKRDRHLHRALERARTLERLRGALDREPVGDEVVDADLSAAQCVRGPPRVSSGPQEYEGTTETSRK